MVRDPEDLHRQQVSDRHICQDQRNWEVRDPAGERAPAPRPHYSQPRIHLRGHHNCAGLLRSRQDGCPFSSQWVHLHNDFKTE